jgi:copper(I)-binding protein
MTGMDTEGGAGMAMGAEPTPAGEAPMAMEGGSMPAGGTSAVYMTIANGGGADDRLLSASSDAAETVELHETTMTDNVMRMAPVEGGILVPARGRAELKPAGLHVMLIGLTRDLKAGDTVRLTLTFERAGSMEIEAPVRQP